MTALKRTLIPLTLIFFQSHTIQAAEVCSTFDGSAIGTTHTERIIFTTNSASNQSLFGRNEVYFGGDTPNVSGNAAQVATTIENNTIHDLTIPGSSITVSGSFYNRNSNPFQLYNESYLAILPSTTTLANPLLGLPIIQREGIIIGTVPDTSTLVGVNSGSSTQASTVLFNTSSNPVAPVENSWFVLSATFAIQGGNLFINSFSVDGVETGIAPIDLGSASNFPWLNSVKAAIAVDDSASEMCVDFDDVTVPPPVLNPTAVPIFTPLGIMATIGGLLWFGRRKTMKITQS